MNRADRRRAVLALAATSCFLLLPQADADPSPPVPPVPSVTPASAQPDYHPSMGDLMTMAVQPRHVKLGMAGNQHNWEYASYELSELRNAFARIARTIPQYQAVDTAQLLTVVNAPLDDLEQAIKAGNAEQFKRTYAALTQICNACHQSMKHSAIVIKVPDGSAYSDQDFRPIAR